MNDVTQPQMANPEILADPNYESGIAQYNGMLPTAANVNNIPDNVTDLDL